MNINIDDPKQILSHVLLSSGICTLVADTPEWKDDKVLDVEVLVNGISIPAEDFENTLKSLIDQVETSVRNKYDADNIDKEIEDRANEILKTHANNALESLHELQQKLENVEDLLVPHWERKNMENGL